MGPAIALAIPFIQQALIAHGIGKLVEEIDKKEGGSYEEHPAILEEGVDGEGQDDWDTILAKTSPRGDPPSQ